MYTLSKSAVFTTSAWSTRVNIVIIYYNNYNNNIIIIYIYILYIIIIIFFMYIYIYIYIYIILYISEPWDVMQYKRLQHRILIIIELIKLM